MRQQHPGDDSSIAIEVPYEYSAEFEAALRAIFPPEDVNGPVAHLGSRNGRLYQVLTFAIPEIEHHLGSIAGLDVVDFGCGTGATAAALRSKGASVVGFDISGPSVEVARLRLAEHGISDVECYVAERIDETPIPKGSFDMVLMNAVIEHVPKSIPGLRSAILNDAYSRLRPGGHLIINQSPNRLIPKDLYVTGLWGLPWTKPGSVRQYRRAVAAGVHPAPADGVPDTEYLEQRGAWGVTYHELMGYLPDDARCVQAEPGHNRRITYTRKQTPRRVAIENLVGAVSGTFGVPLVAFAPMFWPLIIRRSA